MLYESIGRNTEKCLYQIEFEYWHATKSKFNPFLRQTFVNVVIIDFHAMAYLRCFKLNTNSCNWKLFHSNCVERHYFDSNNNLYLGRVLKIQITRVFSPSTSARVLPFFLPFHSVSIQVDQICIDYIYLISMVWLIYWLIVLYFSIVIRRLRIFYTKYNGHIRLE